MRILIKGGVWKNTEDEILKAAVMKYGLNQWARISSLLVRKSAKQCKARWYEWLDPAIKKTEWTREEDEKLLHLAKLMPTQWRTIAPIVGRTAAQCLERYEKLLDMAAGKDAYDAKDDPRRLRPGEIDPHPETKPARPDPIDMDEDEKEMLSEARARLANTKGKKAKRKAREKQMEEARRLASLQKKRELKAAGIAVREKTRRTGGIDYNTEVPFERRPVPGFYDTQNEVERTKDLNKKFRPVSLEEVEGKKRRDVEAALMKQDVQRAKMNERNNAPAVLGKGHDTNALHRGKLMLPAPQVSDAELEALAKADMEGNVELLGGGTAATRALLGEYATPSRLATPLVTPASQSSRGGNRLMEEAANLARLREGQTPLLGGDTVMDFKQSDFGGVVPASQRGGGSTHPGATPRLSGTPLIGGAALPTPVRDALGLNEPNSSVRGAMEKQSRIAARIELKAGLSQLPAPQNDYEVIIPELPQDSVDVSVDYDIEEDAAEARKRRAAEADACRQRALKKRSQVFQRRLPRPLSVLLDDVLGQVLPEEQLKGLSVDEMAEQLIKREFVALIRGEDGVEDPIEIEDDTSFSIEELERASQLLSKELDAMTSNLAVPFEEYEAVHEKLMEGFTYVVSKGGYVRDASHDEKLASMKADFDSVRKEMSKEAKRAAKLENKVGLLTAGLNVRNGKIIGEAQDAWSAHEQHLTDVLSFKALHEQEQLIAPMRLESLQEMVSFQRKREKDLQERYKRASEAKTQVV